MRLSCVQNIDDVGIEYVLFSSELDNKYRL